MSFLKSITDLFTRKSTALENIEAPQDEVSFDPNKDLSNFSNFTPNKKMAFIVPNNPKVYNEYVDEQVIIINSVTYPELYSFAKTFLSHMEYCFVMRNNESSNIKSEKSTEDELIGTSYIKKIDNEMTINHFPVDSNSIIISKDILNYLRAASNSQWYLEFEENIPYRERYKEWFIQIITHTYEEQMSERTLRINGELEKQRLADERAEAMVDLETSM